MSFTYNQNEPARNSNPSVSQPIMQQNAEAINNLIAVDHISFNALGGGQHKQITFNNIIDPGSPSDPVSFLWTNVQALQSSSKPQLYFRNSEATYLANPIKAFATFTTAGPTLSNCKYNVVSVTGTNPYTVTLATNAVTGTSYLVLATNAGSTIAAAGVIYAISSATQFNILTAGTATAVSFIVIQF